MLGRWRIIAAVLAVACSAGIAVGAELGSQPEAPAKQSDFEKLNGTWILANANNSRSLSDGWYSTLLIKDGKFSISRFVGGSKSRDGTFRINQSTSPKSVDFDVDAIDMSELWEGVTYSKGSAAGIYKLDGDRLTVCYAEDGKPRPREFESKESRDISTLSFVRAKPGFKDFPKSVTVCVVDPAGKPVAGASLFHFMNWKRESATKRWVWQYYDTAKTGADGTAQIPYSQLDSRAAGARVAERHLAGFATVTPASSLSGKLQVNLQPECHVQGSLVSKDFADAGRHNLFVMMTLNFNGTRIAVRASHGDFDFVVPPGKYSINVYDKQIQGRWIDINVPSGVAEFRITPPINLAASNLFRIEGHPAPELEGITAWRGKPTKFADLRGKYVIVDFWGFWCGPCVGQMPVWIAVYNRFKDKDLAIVGVHCDLQGDVKTPEQFDKKIAKIKIEEWKGNNLPFPIALTSESAADAHGSAEKQYGISFFPTTILIDRQGIVVGEFSARDEKDAIAQVEKLLKSGK